MLFLSSGGLTWLCPLSGPLISAALPIFSEQWFSQILTGTLGVGEAGWVIGRWLQECRKGTWRQHRKWICRRHDKWKWDLGPKTRGKQCDGRQKIKNKKLARNWKMKQVFVQRLFQWRLRGMWDSPGVQFPGFYMAMRSSFWMVQQQ